MTDIITRTIDIYPDCSGHLENIPAEFSVDWGRPDRGVGIDCWTVDGIELIGFQIGSLKFTRDMLVAMLSEAEVKAIEDMASEAAQMQGAA